MELLSSNGNKTNARDLFNANQLQFNRDGSTSLYEYYAVANFAEYEIDYNMQGEMTMSSFNYDYEGTNRDAFYQALADMGYSKIDSKLSNSEMLDRGQPKNVEIRDEFFVKNTATKILKATVRTVFDGSEVVDYMIGVRTATVIRTSLGRRINVRLTSEGLFFNSLQIDREWSIPKFDQAFGLKGRMVVKTEKERQAALQKYGKPLRSDTYVYDSLGLHLYVDHVTKVITEVSIDFVVNKYQNSPSTPFSGGFLIDENDLSRATTLFDLRYIGFKPAILPPMVKQLNYGDFKLIFEFDSSATTSQLSSVGISFLSDDMVMRNPYGWSDEDVASMRIMLRNQLTSVIDLSKVDLEQMLDCYCNWTKNNVPITELSNPSVELEKMFRQKSSECAEQARKPGKK